MSTASASDEAAIEHHRKVREFLAEISVFDTREYVGSHSNNAELSCIYEMHRNDADDDSTSTRTKLGKGHGTTDAISRYFYPSSPKRRNPFKKKGEDESPPPSAVDGNILLFVDGRDTLFSLTPYRALSNYMMEFIEAIFTAAMFPTLRICPSISMLGDSCFGTNDKKFFDSCRYIVVKIIDGKFRIATHNMTRDEAYSEEEWAEAITLSQWYYQNIVFPRKKGRLLYHREEFLEEIGFNRIWEGALVNNANWMANFRDLKNHVDVAGFKNYPGGYDGKMDNWVRSNRHYLSKLKTDKLRKKNQ